MLYTSLGVRKEKQRNRAKERGRERGREVDIIGKFQVVFKIVSKHHHHASSYVLVYVLVGMVHYNTARALLHQIFDSTSIYFQFQVVAIYRPSSPKI